MSGSVDEVIQHLENAGRMIDQGANDGATITKGAYDRSAEAWKTFVTAVDTALEVLGASLGELTKDAEKLDDNKATLGVAGNELDAAVKGHGGATLGQISSLGREVTEVRAGYETAAANLTEFTTRSQSWLANYGNRIRGSVDAYLTGLNSTLDSARNAEKAAREAAPQDSGHRPRRRAHQRIGAAW